MNVNRALQSIVAACALLAGMCTAAQTRIIYVDAAAAGENDGSSWINAYPYLQDALAKASSFKVPVEIRVAQGTYKPDQDSAHRAGTRDRLASFVLVDNVAIMGGFAGVAASNPGVRDTTLYETILSGDLAGNDIVLPDPRDLLMEPTRSENSYAVVAAGSCSRSAVLDGFTISSGYTIEPGWEGGAGLFLYSSNYNAPCCPSIRNCTFTGNAAHTAGGVYVAGARPELINCAFLRNAGIVAGAIYVTSSRIGTPLTCEFVIGRCTFADNYARDNGGAIEIGYGNPVTIEDTVFIRNSAKTGGAIFVSTSGTASMRNCRVIDNKASEAGGAIYSAVGKELEIASCTIFGNSAPIQQGPRVRLVSELEALQAAPVRIVNTIIWNGENQIYTGSSARMTATYSDVQGGWLGVGNIDSDPLFANPVNWDPNTPHDANDPWIAGDYHLKSQAGRWDPNSRSWVTDDVTSPCIDAGNPNTPVGEEPQPNGGRINMGAYGGTDEASMSVGAKP
jgi:predicted outer membrane repeat protein